MCTQYPLKGGYTRGAHTDDDRSPKRRKLADAVFSTEQGNGSIRQLLLQYIAFLTGHISEHVIFVNSIFFMEASPVFGCQDLPYTRIDLRHLYPMLPDSLAYQSDGPAAIFGKLNDVVAGQHGPDIRFTIRIIFGYPPHFHTV